MKKLGFNYRITDFQCALGISQLSRLDKFVTRRKKLAQKYDNAFINYEGIIIPKIKKNYGHSYHIYPLKINFKKFKISKESFFKKLKKQKINLQVHYIPIHLQPFYKRKFNHKLGDFPIAENFYDQEVSLPIYYGLSDKKLSFIIKKIKEVLKI